MIHRRQVTLLFPRFDRHRSCRYIAVEMDTTLRDELLKLPLDDRMELAADLWDSVVDQQSSIELTDAQRTELVRRLRKAERDPSAGVSWEDLDAELGRG